MKLKFQVLETKLCKGFIVLKCKNMSIPDMDLEEVKDHPLEDMDIEKMTERAIQVMQRKMGAKFRQQRNQRYAHLPVTKQEYQEMGKPTVGEFLTLKVGEKQ